MPAKKATPDVKPKPSATRSRSAQSATAADGSYFGPGMLKFLKALSRNNTRDWFQANKATFEAECLHPLERLAADLLVQLSQIDPAFTSQKPKDLIFRIYRDTRFSADKTPYKTHLALSATPDGKKGLGPGLYVHIGLEEFAAYAGVYAPEPQHLFKIRQEILYHHAELQKIVGAAGFKKYWGAITGEALTRPPKDFSAEDVAEIPLLRNKQFYVTSLLDHTLLTGPGLLEALVRRYTAVAPFNAFLRRAMQD